MTETNETLFWHFHHCLIYLSIDTIKRTGRVSILLCKNSLTFNNVGSIVLTYTPQPAERFAGFFVYKIKLSTIDAFANFVGGGVY